MCHVILTIGIASLVRALTAATSHAPAHFCAGTAQCPFTLLLITSSTLAAAAETTSARFRVSLKMLRFVLYLWDLNNFKLMVRADASASPALSWAAPLRL